MSHGHFFALDATDGGGDGQSLLPGKQERARSRVFRECAPRF